MTDILFLEDEYGVRLPVSDEKIQEIQEYDQKNNDTESHYGIDRPTLKAILAVGA